VDGWLYSFKMNTRLRDQYCGVYTVRKIVTRFVDGGSTVNVCVPWTYLRHLILLVSKTDTSRQFFTNENMQYLPQAEIVFTGADHDKCTDVVFTHKVILNVF